MINSRRGINLGMVVLSIDQQERANDRAQ